MQNLTFAAKLKNAQWKSALIVDNNFQDANIGTSLSDMVLDALSGVLAMEYQEGQEINIAVSIRPMPSRRTARQVVAEGADGQD